MTAHPVGSKLFRAWAVASALYVLVAIGFSLAPIQAAFEAADRTPAAAPAASGNRRAEAPDTPRLKIAKAVGKQALIVLAPPALVLWFGWDAWFAITGFFPSRRTRSDEARDPARDAEG